MTHPGARLRARMHEGLAQVMATHSPLSARLAEEAGFDGVWASGFELSALHGVPDASLLSATQHLDMVRAIADQTAIPIVADLDTGHGNAINVRHLVRQYERAGTAAVVLEDKTFPKTTSLRADAHHQLVSIAEFQGKLAAATEVRASADFLVIGRTEALIAGCDLGEALDRAHAYAEAGADAVLVHSKQRTPDEIVAFARAWTGARPLVIVPTAYPSLGAGAIRALDRVRMVIYGNHAIRACITAMQRLFATVRADGDIGRAHETIVPVEEVFRLQRTADMLQAEARYLRG